MKGLLLTIALTIFPILAQSDDISISTVVPINNELFEEVTDIDGNIYKSVLFGNKKWFAQNLKVTHYRNGDKIPTDFRKFEWRRFHITKIGAYATYNDDPGNADLCGYLYNFYTIKDDRGVCPEGWHVPTDKEWMELEIYLGMNKNKVKSSGLRGTNEGSQLASNNELWQFGELVNETEFGTSGFNALPCGYREADNGEYLRSGKFGSFWSSTTQSNNVPLVRYLFSTAPEVYRSTSRPWSGLSIRCIGDSD
jgi:uncharacterized protein (TIGR02145 family)